MCPQQSIAHYRITAKLGEGVVLTEIMPVEIRTTGYSFADSSAIAVFGGFTPAICAYLIHVSGNRAAPGLRMSFAGRRVE